MLGVKILMALGVGVALGVVGLVVVYPFYKTVLGGFEILRAWAGGPALGLTLADGGEETK